MRDFEDFGVAVLDRGADSTTQAMYCDVCRAEWTFSINGNRRVKHVNFIKSHYVNKNYTHLHKTILSSLSNLIYLI